MTEPVPGNNVELTIDISLQAVAEHALEKVILYLRETGVGTKKEGKDAQGGAVVVQMCKTGEILAMASYPTYNLATFNQDYTTLNADEMRPLFNRALAAFPPGSVYKMVTAIAAVDMGGFDPGYIIEDKGLYTFYESFQPKCHIWSLANPRTHGKINLMEAIAYSCNYYFYEVGRLTYDTYKKETGETRSTSSPRRSALESRRASNCRRTPARARMQRKRTSSTLAKTQAGSARTFYRPSSARA